MIARDREVDNKYSKDFQVTAIHGARNLLADKIVRVVAPHKILDPKNGPLIAVRLHLLTRKTLGGLETNLDSQVIKPTAVSSTACTQPVKSRASAAAESTVTAHSRGPSSAAASSRAAQPDEHWRATCSPEIRRANA